MRNLLLTIILSICLLGEAKADEVLTDVITTYGQASISQAPDVLRFSIYVEQNGQNADALSEEVDDKISQMIEALFDQGVLEKDLQSMTVNLYPWYERNGQTRKQNGFVYSRNISVTLRDFSRYPAVLNDILKLGASRIDGFRYEIEDKEKAYKEALKKAVDNAKARAVVLAESAQVTLEEVTVIQETSSYSSMPQSRARLSSMSESDSFQPGNSEISANVTVTYRISHLHSR